MISTIGLKFICLMMIDLAMIIIIITHIIIITSSLLRRLKIPSSLIQLGAYTDWSNLFAHDLNFRWNFQPKQTDIAQCLFNRLQSTLIHFIRLLTLSIRLVTVNSHPANMILTDCDDRVWLLRCFLFVFLTIAGLAWQNKNQSH